MKSTVINNEIHEGVIKYLSSIKEVECILLTKDENEEGLLTLVCYKNPKNALVNNLPIIINKSKSYQPNSLTYYNEKLNNSEILFDRNSRLTKIKEKKEDFSKKLTI